MPEPKFKVIEGGNTELSEVSRAEVTNSVGSQGASEKAKQAPSLRVVAGTEYVPPVSPSAKDKEVIVFDELSPEQRWKELEKENAARHAGFLYRLGLISKDDVDQHYAGLGSRPPRPGLIEEKVGDTSFVNYKATLFAYRAVRALDSERKSGKYGNGEKAPYGDEDEILVSWVEGDYEDGNPSEYTGILKRKDLAKILKLGLSMPFEERHRLGIPVADSGPRCIFYPFLHTFDYITPEAFGGSIKEEEKKKGWLKSADEESPFIRKYKNIKKEGHVVRSEMVAPYTASPYLTLAVEIILKGHRFMSKADQEFYDGLLKPWEGTAAADEVEAEDMKMAA